MDEKEYHHPWITAALELGRRQGTWSSIKPGSAADQAWHAYFDSIGFRPSAVTMGTPYTMPVASPSDLPHDWQPIPPEPRRWPDDVRKS